MTTITSSVTIRELREDLAEAVNRASQGHERVQITKNGKPAAVLIGPEDFELLEQLEMHRDVAEYRAAKAVDDGGRVRLDMEGPTEGSSEVRRAARLKTFAKLRELDEAFEEHEE
jgi:prevent-host-death family protein